MEERILVFLVTLDVDLHELVCRFCSGLQGNNTNPAHGLNNQLGGSHQNKSFVWNTNQQCPQSRFSNQQTKRNPNFRNFQAKVAKNNNSNVVFGNGRMGKFSSAPRLTAAAGTELYILSRQETKRLNNVDGQEYFTSCEEVYEAFDAMDTSEAMSIRDQELRLDEINTLDWDELLVPGDTNKIITTQEGRYSVGSLYQHEVNGHKVDVC